MATDKNLATRVEDEDLTLTAIAELEDKTALSFRPLRLSIDGNRATILRISLQ